MSLEYIIVVIDEQQNQQKDTPKKQSTKDVPFEMYIHMVVVLFCVYSAPRVLKSIILLNISSNYFPRDYHMNIHIVDKLRSL